MDCFQIGKGVHQGCTLSPLLTLNAQFSSVQSLSHVQLFATTWTVAHQASLSITTNSWIYANSCPLSWWCHPTISSSAVPFSSHLQSFPALRSFQMSHLFTSEYIMQNGGLDEAKAGTKNTRRNINKPQTQR